MHTPAGSLQDQRNAWMSLDPVVIDRDPAGRTCITEASPEAGGEQTCLEAWVARAGERQGPWSRRRHVGSFVISITTAGVNL